MRRRQARLVRPREALLAGSLFVLSISALVLAAQSETLAPRGPLPDVASLLLFCLATSACMLHRPFAGSTLGAGAVVVVPVLVHRGAVPAAIVAAIALVGADLVRRFLRRRSPDVAMERRRWWRSIEHGACLVLALLAGAPLAAADPSVRSLLAAGGVYAVVLGGLRIADKKLRRPEERVPWVNALAPLGVDLGAWAAGIALSSVATTSGWTVAAVLVAAFSLICLETARNALLYGHSRRRVEDLERLSRASRRIAGSPTETGFGIVAERIRIECTNVVPFQWFQFELLGGEADYRSWWSGPDRHLQEGVPRVPENPPPRPGIHRRRGWEVLERSLETEEELLGRLRLWCDPRELTAQQVNNLDSLLPQMIASLERAILDLEAKQDPLTGLALRRVLEERLQKSFRRSHQAGSPMAIIMCDLDHFKSVNDNFGHAAGDKALKETAALLLAAAVGEDRLAARYGGEEFLLLLDGSEGGQALELAEEIRQRVEELRVLSDDQRLPLTLSLGVSCFPEIPVKRPQELVELADEALYEAKRHGRNRCLLNLGRGLFRTARGGTVKGETARDEAPAPQIFA